MYNLSAASLIRIELFKNKNWINLALFGLLLFLTYFNIDTQRMSLDIDNVINYDSSFYQMYIAGLYTKISPPVVLFFIISVGGEISKGHLSKNIIDGFSRSNFYLGKLYLAFIVSFFLVIFQLVVLALIPLFNDLSTNILIYTEISDISFLFIDAFISCLLGIFFGIVGGSALYGVIAYYAYNILETTIIQFTKDKIDLTNYTLNDCLLSAFEFEPLAWSQVITIMIYVLILTVASYKILLKKEL